jgi:uncharacterized protein (UPF0335 family)
MYELIHPLMQNINDLLESGCKDQLSFLAKIETLESEIKELKQKLNEVEKKERI